MKNDIQMKGVKQSENLRNEISDQRSIRFDQVECSLQEFRAKLEQLIAARNLIMQENEQLKSAANIELAEITAIEVIRGETLIWNNKFKFNSLMKKSPEVIRAKTLAFINAHSKFLKLEKDVEQLKKFYRRISIEIDKSLENDEIRQKIVSGMNISQAVKFMREIAKLKEMKNLKRTFK